MKTVGFPKLIGIIGEKDENHSTISKRKVASLTKRLKNLLLKYNGDFDICPYAREKGKLGKIVNKPTKHKKGNSEEIFSLRARNLKNSAINCSRNRYNNELREKVKSVNSLSYRPNGKSNKQ
jgi:hypothetical protein